ncbi:importin [Salix suchowensis]|nr:importin [Salix suchowensis]
MPKILKSSKAAIDALILSTQTSLLQLAGPVLKIDQIKSFLSVIMDVLDTSILIPEGNEASQQGKKVRRKVVAHGIGVAAAFGGSIFKPLVGEAVSALNANISNPMALHRYYIMAHDAAVTALGKICLFYKDRINARLRCVNPSNLLFHFSHVFSSLYSTDTYNIYSYSTWQVFSTWLSRLPIKNNLLEVKIAHDLLCLIVEIMLICCVFILSDQRMMFFANILFIFPESLLLLQR